MPKQLPEISISKGSLGGHATSIDNIILHAKGIGQVEIPFFKARQMFSDVKYKSEQEFIFNPSPGIRWLIQDSEYVNFEMVKE